MSFSSIFTFGRKPKPVTLETVRDQLVQLQAQQLQLMSDTTKLTAAVAANTTATNAAVAAIKQLQQPPASDDQAAIDAATAQVQANTDALNGAVPAPVAP